MNTENSKKTMNQRLSESNIKTIRGFYDQRLNREIVVLEYNGISIKRPNVFNCKAICLDVFGINI
jgi:hypothetical protein